MMDSGSHGVLNVLTFDVEDWFHGLGFPEATWPHLEPRLAIGLNYILDLLDRYQVKATFFVLGALVERWRSILGRIVEAGHEVGLHGYRHTPIYRLSPTEFRSDLQQGLAALHRITPRPIKSYRAPFFSITQHSLWALPILAEAGIHYDSSIFPIYNPRYGIPAAHRLPHSVCTPALLIECPVSTIPMGRLNLPFSGGFYARLLPYPLIRQATQRLNNNGQPTIFYFHPWEFDPGQPRIRGTVSWLYRFTHYYGLDRTTAKLTALLRDFSFGRLGDLFPLITTINEPVAVNLRSKVALPSNIPLIKI